MELQLSGTDFSITSPLISSQDLILTFKSNGAEVLVNGVRQISGKTMNNFSKPVTYRVVDGSGSYTEYTVSITGSGLPVLFIETPDHATIPDKHSDWLAGTQIKLYNPDWTIDYEGMTGIRGRGNSTWGYPKKPYAMKLDSKAEILGMPKHKRWVLLANWLDRTLLRNHIAFKIATMTDLAYTPRGQFVEVYLNGKHNGCYLLCEHIKVDKNRVNVDELEDDLTDSGYIMELDSYFDEVNKFRSAHYDLPYMFKDPDEVNEAQFAFIENYVNNMEESLIDDARFATREYRGITWIEDVVKNIPHTLSLPGGVYNFGAENTLNTYETALEYARILGIDAEKAVLADTERFPEHVRNISISMKKAHDASGGKISFRNTIDGLAAFEQATKLHSTEA